MASHAMFVSWIIWKESNMRVFGNKSTTSTMVVPKLKEASLWCLAEANIFTVSDFYVFGDQALVCKTFKTSSLINENDKPF
jgi:hypothetical protein